jgi:hypothetical protein
MESPKCQLRPRILDVTVNAAWDYWRVLDVSLTVDVTRPALPAIIANGRPTNVSAMANIEQVVSRLNQSYEHGFETKPQRR